MLANYWAKVKEPEKRGKGEGESNCLLALSALTPLHKRIVYLIHDIVSVYFASHRVSVYVCNEMTMSYVYLSRCVQMNNYQ